MRTLLPIGSVVLLEGAEKRLMICGRLQTDVSTGKTYDYSGCLYPEGVLDSKEFFMFNNENIKKLYFVGFQDGEELGFRKFLDEQRGVMSSPESEGEENA